MKFKKLYTDIIKTTTGRIGSAAFTFLKTVILVRLIEPEIYGEIAVLFSWALIITAIFEVGGGSAFIALESQSENSEQYDRFWSLLRSRVLISSFFLIFGILLAFFIHHPDFFMIFAALILGIGQTICHSPEILLQTQKRFKRYSQLIIVISFIQLLWSTLSVLLYKYSILNEIFFWFMLSFSSWISAIVPMWLIKKETPHFYHFNIRNDIKYFVRIFAFGKWIVFAGILTYLYRRWAVILLGSYGKTADAAAYDVALNVSQILNILTLSVISALSPRFASISDWNLIKRGFKKIFQIGGPLILVALGGYYLFGSELVALIFGKKYLMSTGPLDALIPGFLFTVLTEPIVAFVTYGLKRPNIIFFVSTLKTISFILFGAWIMEIGGLFGLGLFQTIMRIFEHIIIAIIAFILIRKS